MNKCLTIYLAVSSVLSIWQYYLAHRSTQNLTYVSYTLHISCFYQGSLLVIYFCGGDIGLLHTKRLPKKEKMAY